MSSGLHLFIMLVHVSMSNAQTHKCRCTLMHLLNFKHSASSSFCLFLTHQLANTHTHKADQYCY